MVREGCNFQPRQTLPHQTLGEGRGLTIGLTTNSQWRNQSCLWNAASSPPWTMKFRELPGWWTRTHPCAGRVVNPTLHGDRHSCARDPFTPCPSNSPGRVNTLSTGPTMAKWLRCLRRQEIPIQGRGPKMKWQEARVKAHKSLKHLYCILQVQRESLTSRLSAGDGYDAVYAWSYAFPHIFIQSPIDGRFSDFWLLNRFLDLEGTSVFSDSLSFSLNLKSSWMEGWMATPDYT